MHIRYFADTDTALVEFSDNAPVETRELSENISFSKETKHENDSCLSWDHRQRLP